VVGAVGGGYAGHEIEKRVRSTTVHELTVRLADGSTRSFRRTQPWDVRVGDVIAMPESTSAAAPSKPRPAPSLPEPQPSETRA
jgi:outer membrane lipoprotein SlyB